MVTLLTPFPWQVLYEANEITGFADTDPLTQWDDLSGNARHLVESVIPPIYITAPANLPAGCEVVRFDGTDDYMQCATAGAAFVGGTVCTMVIAGVFRGTSLPHANGRLIVVRQDSQANDYDNAASALIYAPSALSTYRNNSGVSTGTIPGFDAPFVAIAIYDGSNVEMWVNGVSFGSAANTGTFAVDRVMVGRGWAASSLVDPVRLDMVAVAVSATAFGIGDRKAVENILMERMGLQVNVTATLSGTGSLTANTQAQIPIVASLAGAGDLTATLGASQIPITASLSGTGDLSATLGASLIPISATIAGAGDLVATLDASAIPITATISGVGDLTANTNADISIEASLSGLGALTATLGASTIPIEAALSGAGDLVADFTLIIPISASLSGTGTLTATLEPGWPDTQLTAIGDLLADTQADIPISASLDGTGTLVADTQAEIPIEAVQLSGVGALSAETFADIPLIISLSGTGDLIADFILDIPIEGTLSGTGTLVALADVPGVGFVVTFDARPREFVAESHKRILSATAPTRITSARAGSRR